MLGKVYDKIIDLSIKKEEIYKENYHKHVDGKERRIILCDNIRIKNRNAEQGFFCWIRCETDKIGV